MMNSSSELADRYRETMRRFLWEQWVDVGLAGHGRKIQGAPFMIDPEALLLATSRFAAGEARFIEEVIDWLSIHAEKLVTQRIKNLQLRYQFGDVIALQQINKALLDRGIRGWRDLQPLLMDTGQARARGLAQSLEPAGLRGMSGPPHPDRSSNAIFTLRALFGGNARAEVVAWLLTHDKGHPAEIARETGWNSNAIQQILNDLENSGMVYVEQGGREKRFRLDGQRWLRWLRPDSEEQGRNDLAWLNQGAFYLGCLYVDWILEDLASLGDRSDRLQAITIRNGMEQAIGKMALSMTTAFEMANVGFLFEGLNRQNGAEMVEHFRAGVERLSQLLEAGGKKK